MVTNRNVATAIILSIITCGIYAIYWFVVLTDDTNTVSGNTGDTSGGMALLFTLITCGIYGWYWYYKMGEKLDQAAMAKGMPAQSRGILYLVLGFFGLGIISYALMQDTINKVA